MIFTFYNGEDVFLGMELSGDLLKDCLCIVYAGLFRIAELTFNYGVCI